MTLEQIGVVAGILVAFLSLLTPLVRLNGLLSRLNALLDGLEMRTLRCEARLDELETRACRSEAELATIRESLFHAHHRLDELNKE